jgi:signal transduction histidine kinase
LKRVSSKIMFLIIICCIFTAFLIGGFSLYQGSKFIKAEANSKLMYMSRSYANEFSQTFEKAESGVNSIYDTITATFDMDAFRKDPKYLDKYIKGFDPLMKSFVSDNDNAMLGLYITFNPFLTNEAHELWYEDLGGNGKFYKVSPATIKKYSLNYSGSWAIYPNTPEFMDSENKAMEYLYKTIKERKPLWFDPYKELGLDVTAISYVMPIIIDDTVIGVVGMDLNFETIKKQIRGMPVYDHGYAFLMNESADILVHPDARSQINLKDIDKERYSSLLSEILKRPYGSFNYSHKTESEIISYSKLSNGWILALVSPNQEVFKPVRDLSFVIVLLTLAGIAISIFAAYLFSRKVSNTMDRAAAQLRYIEIGDFTQEIPEELLKGDDDLGHFIKSVYTLQNVIRDLIKTIETKEAGIFSDPLLLRSAVEKTQNASSNAAIAIGQISLDRVEKEENLRDTLKKLEEFNTKLQVMVKEEVQKNRQKDAVVIYQSRLAKMGEMIGNIAHQWRQPLNSLSIILSELKDSFNYGELDREYLEDSVSKSKQIIAKMSQTIDDFRNYLSPSKEEATFSVGQSILFILELMEESLRSSNIRVETDLIPDAVVSGYENEFSQVISNILNNARDALEESDLPQKLVSVTVEKNDNLIEIKISNNGHPITAEVMSKLFTPYFTTKTLGKGTGIGLYMSRIIIEEHMRGKIRFQNIGHGVCCSMVLPAYEMCDAVISSSLPAEVNGKEHKEVKDGLR